MSDSLRADAGGPRTVPEIWGRVPLRNKNFTGREEILQQLADSLMSTVTAVVDVSGTGVTRPDPGASQPGPMALHGLGGVGKTQVAIEYAYRYQGLYDLVWWIPADQPMLLRSSLAALAPRLGLPPATATSIEDAAAAVLEALRRGRPYDRWLLIFDNADEPDDIREILPHGPRTGHVLITSRNHRWQNIVGSVPVNVFNRDESIKFLTKRVPSAASDPHVNRLAEELGDLPLALEQAAAVQAETGMSIQEYLRLFKDQTAKLLAEGKPSGYPVPLTVAWSLSVSQLKERLPEAIELLRCCAFFGPEPIPRDVLVPLSKDFQDPSAADHYPPVSSGQAGESVRSNGASQAVVDEKLERLLNDAILLSNAIGELGRYALVKIDTKSRTIQVHRLVQALLRGELSDTEKLRVRHMTHLLLANAAPTTGPPDMRTNWSRFEELLGHAGPSRLVKCPHRLVRSFCLDLVRFLYTSGDPQEAKSFVEKTIDAWRANSGAEDPSVLDARRHLGIILRELGDYQAAYENNRAVLESMIRVFGAAHEITLLQTNSFGADIRARGQFGVALKHDEESLRNHEAKFGPDDRRTLRAANNLAVDYALISNYARSRELHERTLTAQRVPDSGVSPQDTMICWNGLARVLRLAGQYDRAVDVGNEAYAFGGMELSAQHPQTLRTAKDLSIALRMSGSDDALDEGLDMATDTYQRELRQFGLDHPDTLAAAMNLANAHRVNGSVDEGFALADEAMNGYTSVFGEDHPYIHACRVNIALFRRVRGELDEALKLDQDALAKLTGQIGEDHHFTLTCALNLASDHAFLGETRQARDLGQRTLERLTVTLGENHPMTIACAANLVSDLKAEGATAQADRLADEVRAKYDRVLSLHHPNARAFQRGQRIDFDIDPPPL
jgi:tetratricopeptide (TPR) repeat protein